jgi:predicted ATP-dependent protease
MASAALELPVRPGLAMTGEVALHGHVEAVGGIAQKIVAAAHHQRRTVIIPAANAADLLEVPDDVLGKIEVVTVARIEGGPAARGPPRWRGVTTYVLDDLASCRPGLVVVNG